MLTSHDAATLGSTTGSCVTMGNFDGVHLGHKSLISLAGDKAREAGLDFTLVTFWPHPKSVLASASPANCLTSREERSRLLEKYGVAKLLEIPFTPTFAALTAKEFIEKWILPLNPLHLVVGHDFAFGHNREGNLEFLTELGKTHGFSVTQAPPLCLAGEPISSSRLRRAIAKGQIEAATAMLGRFYSVEGLVEKGFGRGEKLGFPTANLAAKKAFLPANGVYATFAYVNGKTFQAVTNIGRNPTFDGSNLTVESFLLDGRHNLYNESLRLEFVARLRGERKFNSPQELVEQIGRDVEQARCYLDLNCKDH